jgi:predicted aldo/keto reductase-like oxidoreductase
MTEAEQYEMERLRKELGTRFCRRCNYCQPCPEGVSISIVMVSNSFFKRMPLERLFTGMFAQAIESAANCTECGECEERCPYHLPIREMIAEHLKQYQEERVIYQERLASR